MTTLTTNAPSGFSPLAALGAFLRRRAAYSRVYRELSLLSDRELEDIGLHRSLIADVASEAAAIA